LLDPTLKEAGLRKHFAQNYAVRASRARTLSFDSQDEGDCNLNNQQHIEHDWICWDRVDWKSYPEMQAIDAAEESCNWFKACFSNQILLKKLQNSGELFMLIGSFFENASKACTTDWHKLCLEVCHQPNHFLHKKFLEYLFTQAVDYLLTMDDYSPLYFEYIYMLSGKDAAAYCQTYAKKITQANELWIDLGICCVKNNPLIYHWGQHARHKICNLLLENAITYHSARDLEIKEIMMYSKTSQDAPSPTQYKLKKINF